MIAVSIRPLESPVTEGPILQISGFGVHGFRTLVDATVICDGALTVICGPNNAGKSSLLEALMHYSECLSGLRTTRGAKIAALEKARVEIAVPLGSGPLEQLWLKAGNSLEGFDSVISKLAPQLPHHRIWLEIRGDGERLKVAGASKELITAFSSVATADRNFRRFVERAGAPQQGYNEDNWQARVSRLLRNLLLQMPIPEMVRISDVRRSADAPLSAEELGVLARDSNLRSDGSRREPWTETLALILKDTFGPAVEYHVVPRGDSGEFQLNLDGDRDIDLSEVGAGVREVVAVAYKALHSSKRTVLLIEEPENCLHPMAVRRMLQSLVHTAGLQVIATTHSSAVIDSNPSSVVQVTRTESGTVGIPVIDTTGRFEAIRSLGYSPSELLLAPCAVWVEGPSDRIYLKIWLANHGMVEGVDYQIMFYGGSLGSHVSIEMDPTTEQAVALRLPSRRCVIIADSDRNSPRGGLKPHVRRWREESASDPHSYLWVTPGREVENLLPLETINAFRVARRQLPIIESERRFAHVFGEIARPNKVGFAKEVVKDNTNVPPDAVNELAKIARFIAASKDRIEMKNGP